MPRQRLSHNNDDDDEDDHDDDHDRDDDHDEADSQANSNNKIATTESKHFDLSCGAFFLSGSSAPTDGPDEPLRA